MCKVVSISALPNDVRYGRELYGWLMPGEEFSSLGDVLTHIDRELSEHGKEEDKRERERISKRNRMRRWRAKKARDSQASGR
jgi:hypothetical protein